MTQGGDDQGDSEDDDGLQEGATWRPQGPRCWEAVGNFCQSPPGQDLPKSKDKIVCHHSWVRKDLG